MNYLNIDAYSHGIRLHGYSRNVYDVLVIFLDRLQLKEEKRLPRHLGGQMVVEVKKKFFGMLKNRREVYLHRNSLDALLSHLANHGISQDKVTINYIAPPSAVPVSIEVFDHFVARDYQGILIEEMGDTHTRSRKVDLATGLGKDQPLHAKIKVPGGWSTMGDMVVGKTITAWDGTPTKVTGVYPQGRKLVYEVICADGRVAEAGGEHLWEVNVANAQEGGRWRVMNTMELKHWIDETQSGVYIPLCRSEEGGDKEYTLDPYTLGAVLRSEGSIVPEVYLHGSRQQRLALLNGLLDNDITIPFNTPSYDLANNVQYLFRSLGGIATLTTDDGTFRVGGQFGETLKNRVVAVRPVGMEETQCISVDHPDRLYVTNDFIVTHNTFTSLQACVNRGERFTVMLAPKYFGLWIGALNDTFKTFKDTPGQLITVSGSNELKMVMNQALEGTLDAKVVIISNTTYRNYIETYEMFGEAIVDYGYPVVPQRFHELLQAGLQINDEFHEDLGLTFRIDCFTNVKKQVYLSATPYSGDKFVTNMVDIMLPEETHCTIPEPPKYINVLELLYNDDVEKKDYLTPFKNTYNHARYEKMMMKKKRRLNTYLSKVAKVVDKAFVTNYEPGQKMLILCATVDFIQVMTKYLRLKFPNCKIGHYVSGVNYDTVAKNDITVSTIKSAGTGVDIRNLRDTLLLQAVNSRKDNIQILGRTRPLKDWPDVTPRLIYLTCMDIKQHGTYAKNKKEIFAGRVLNSRTMRI